MAASVGYVLSQLQRWTSPDLSELSDTVLLERFIQKRCESAFAALVARHGGMVLHSCRQVLGDAHEAEDAFQATFLILARKAHTLRQPAALPGYLHSVARRVALKARTKAVAHVEQTPLHHELPDARGDPLERLTARELLTVLDREVARLPRAQRSAVVLCCLEGHTREEAANLLGCRVGSRKGHLERGRRRLQARLRRRGIALSAALALVTVSRDEAAPPLLVHSAVRAAPNSGLGGSTAALAHSVLQAMLLSKLTGVLAVVLTVALAASATVALIYRSPVVEVTEDEVPVSVDPPKAPATLVDRFGDPLPGGALLRLGTIRYRAGGVVFHAALSPDGKMMATATPSGISFFDLATGRSQPLRDSSVAAFSDNSGSLLAFSPDGKQLVNVTKGGNLHFWDVATFKRLRVVGDRREPAPGERAFAVLAPPPGVTHFSKVWFPPEGKEVVVGTPAVAGTPDNVMLFLEPSTGKILRRIHVVSQLSIAVRE